MHFVTYRKEKCILLQKSIRRKIMVLTEKELFKYKSECEVFVGIDPD